MESTRHVPEPNRISMLKRLALATAPALLVVAAVEFAFRLSGALPAPPPVSEFTPDAPARKMPVYLKRRTVEGVDYLYSPWLPSRYDRAASSRTRRLMRARKADGAYRVFALGGSSTAGSPYGEWGSFSRFIRDEMERAARPGIAVEVMNFGLSGGRSHEALRLMSDLAQYRPDLVIVYAGHNEACEPLRGSARGPLGALHGWLTQHSAAAAGLARWLAPAPARPPDPFGRFHCGGELPAVPGSLERIAGRFGDNMRELVLLARDSGAEVLLLSQFSNLFDHPLDFSEPIDRAGEAARGLQHRLMHAFGRQDFETARDLVEAIRGVDPGAPLADFYEGLLLLNSGRTEGARAALVRAVERDRSPRRFRPSYTAALEALAEADPHVHFLDLRSLAARRLEDGLVDGRLMVDVMHPNLEGQRLIAEAVLDRFVKARRIRPDLFDHDALRPERVYLPVEELDFYPLICRRYYGLESWQECVERASAEYANARGPGAVADRRRARRVWENLFFYSQKMEDPRLLQQSRDIYASRTEAVRRALGASRDAAAPGEAP